MSTRRWLVAFVAVAGFMAGLVVHTAAGGSGAKPTLRNPAEGAPGVVDRAAGEPESSRHERGMPVGFTHSEAGARAAAMAYATASQRWLYMTDAEIAEAVAVIATPEAAPGLASEVVSEVSIARDALSVSPGRVWWLVRPLATRIQDYAPDHTRVSVWTITILSAADVAVPQADWLTVTVDLAWSDGDWRVTAVDDEVGPTPTAGVRDEPWSPERFDEALTGFERVDAQPTR